MLLLACLIRSLLGLYSLQLFLKLCLYSYLILSPVTIICMHDPSTHLLCVSIIFIIFLAPFILSHLLFFRHTTNTASATAVSPSQRIIFCTIPQIISALWGFEAPLRKVTRGRCLRRNEDRPSKSLSFRDKNKSGLYFPPLNCQTTGNHHLLECKCKLFLCFNQYLSHI